MKSKIKKPFIPRDKPKSWVVGILSGLVGLIVAAPIMVLGAYLEIPLIGSIGKVLFFGCWLCFFISWLFFMPGFLSGKYRNIEEKEWGEQQW